MAKALTREQVEGRKAKAARAAESLLGDPDRADEIENESIESYAARRGFTLTNNPTRRSRMPKNNPTKADLEDIVDQVQQILEGAYLPESTREDLASAVGDALDALGGEEEEEDEDLDEDDDDANGD